MAAVGSVGSVYAARCIIDSAVRAILPVRSVIDICCARGTRLREWRAQTVDYIVGVDGPYIDRSELEIDLQCFVVHDLSERFNIGRRFDLAQSLEVGEHLPPARAGTFVADIIAHAPVVLFSAATRRPAAAYSGQVASAVGGGSPTECTTPHTRLFPKRLSNRNLMPCHTYTSSATCTG